MTQWRLLLEEYASTVVHKAGELNLGADALSRFPMKRKPKYEAKWEVPKEAPKYSNDLEEKYF